MYSPEGAISSSTPLLFCHKSERMVQNNHKSMTTRIHSTQSLGGGRGGGLIKCIQTSTCIQSLAA